MNDQEQAQGSQSEKKLLSREATRDLIKTLLSLSREQRDQLWASVEACADVVGPPNGLGRPRGSKNRKKSDPTPQPALIAEDSKS